jgi:hypothetical protein
MCRIAGLFLLQRLKGSMPDDVHEFNNIETRAIIMFLYCKERRRKKFTPLLQKRYGTCTIVCHRQKLGDPN